MGFLPTRSGFAETQTLETVLALTFDKRAKKPVNATFEDDPMLDIAFRKAKVGSEGAFFRYPIERSKNPTSQWMTDGGTIALTQNDPIRTAIYESTMVAVNVTLIRREVQRNAGPEKVADLAMTLIKNAENTLKNDISTAFAGRHSGNSMLGILDYNDLTTAGYNSGTWAGTIGGVSRVTEEYWRPYVYDMIAASTATNLLMRMSQVWKNVSKYGQKSTVETPDVIVTSQAGIVFYENAYQGTHYELTVTKSPLSGDLAVRSPMFNGVPVVWTPFWPTDEQSTPWSRYDFINFDYAPLNFVKTKSLRRTGWKEPDNQVGDKVMQIFMDLQWCWTGPDRQGCLMGIGETA